MLPWENSLFAIGGFILGIPVGFGIIEIIRRIAEFIDRHKKKESE